MDIFKCGICFERYDEDEKRVPRTLTECGHTICEICALKLLKNSKVVCPFDRIESEVYDGNIKFLKKNFTILEAIQEQLYKTKNVETEHDDKYEAEKALGISCDEDGSHIAVLYCTKCEAHYCERCSIVSHSLKTLASHKIVKVSEKPEPLLYCPLHSYNVAELYCIGKECEIENKVMCGNCHLYGAHKSHVYETINEVFYEKMKETCETLEQTHFNIEIVRSCINDIGELPGNINEDQEYIDAKNKIDEIFEERLEELNNWKQLNMEILEKETKAKIESNKIEKEYYCSQLEELETLKLECSNTKQLKKTEYFEKLEEIEIIKEKLKSFEKKKLEKISMKALVEYPNVITFEKQTSKGNIVLYYGGLICYRKGEQFSHVREQIDQLGCIEYEIRKFQLEDQQIEVLSYEKLRNCKDIKIKALVILSYPNLNGLRYMLGEKYEKLNTDGILIFGRSKQSMKADNTGYWNYNIPDIAKHIQVPLLFANHEDSKFVENIMKGNHLENPFFDKYP